MIVLVLFLTQAVYGQDVPTIQGDIRNQTVKEYTDAFMNCKYKAEATTTAVVQWIKIDSQNPVLISVGESLLASSSKYKVGLTNTTSSLTIKNVSRTDAGRYRCIVRVPILPYTQWPQKDGFLFVKVMPRIQEGTKTFSGLLLQNGVLTCKVADLSSTDSLVQWIKIDTRNPALISIGDRVDSKDKYDVKLTTNGSVTTSLLTVINLSREDAGTYRCIVQTRGIPYTEWPQQDLSLSVHAWPAIQGKVQNQTVFEGKDGTFYCNITDLTSNSQVKWARVKQGNQIMINEDVRFKTKIKKYRINLAKNGNWSLSTLIIGSATKEDSGWFRCMVQTQKIPYTQWPQEDGYLFVNGSFGRQNTTSKSTGGNNGCSEMNLSFSLVTICLHIIALIYT